MSVAFHFMQIQGVQLNRDPPSSQQLLCIVAKPVMHLQLHVRFCTYKHTYSPHPFDSRSQLWPSVEQTFLFSRVFEMAMPGRQMRFVAFTLDVIGLDKLEEMRLNG